MVFFSFEIKKLKTRVFRFFGGFPYYIQCNNERLKFLFFYFRATLLKVTISERR